MPGVRVSKEWIFTVSIEAPQVRQASTTPGKGFAVTALSVGIGALLFGFTPVFGILVGAAAVAFGVVALVKKQSKGLSLTGIILGCIGFLVSLAMTIALAGGVTASVDTEPMVVDEAVESIAVPDLVGLPGDEAKEALEAVGLVVTFESDSGKTVWSPRNWKVVGMEPKPGTAVTKGSAIVVRVESDSPEVITPQIPESAAWELCHERADAEFPGGVTIHGFQTITSRNDLEGWNITLIATAYEEDELGHGVVLRCEVSGHDGSAAMESFSVEDG